MVLTNSDSNNTLVSLGNDAKRTTSWEAVESISTSSAPSSTFGLDFQCTELRAPMDLYALEDDEISFQSCDESYSNSRAATPSETRIYLPTEKTSSSSAWGVDECLRSAVPSLVDANETLLEQGVVHYNKNIPTSQRILYVGQGEVAHAVPMQTDVLVSDRATTCHILAVRSTSGRSVPLASLTHIDGPGYDACLKDIMAKHELHHNANSTDGEQSNKIQLDIHIVGGFLDASGTSRDLSEWLLLNLSKLATEYQDSIVMTLQTCAITCMNDNGCGSPVGRGLAINLHTGTAFLAACDDETAMGPCPRLRSVRLWCKPEGKPSLSVIHDERSQYVRVQPFAFAPFEGIDALLSLPDNMLLQYTSTSPHCEQDDFCSSVRGALAFLRQVSPKSLFGPCCDQPLLYKRRSNGLSNAWELVAP